MRALVTGDEAGAADRRAVDAGDTWDGLLARAGHALAGGVLTELRARADGVYGRRVTLLAGKGDNGGDAWVAAARLRDRGVACTVVAVHGVAVDTSSHTARARARWVTSGGRVLDGIGDRARLVETLDECDVVVDAMLGTGIRGAPRDPVAAVIEVLAELQEDGAPPVVACDVPSGVDGDTGAIAGEAVDAVRTVTFGACKRGLVLHPGAAHAGVVEVADLGPRWTLDLDREPTPDEPDWSVTETPFDGRIDRLRVDEDKRARGRVLVVAGSERYAGAAVLAAAAAVRAGAGLVTLATTAPREPVLATEPGIMVVSLPSLDAGDDDLAGGPSVAAVDTMRTLAADADAVVVGPGLGHGPGTRAVVDALLPLDVAIVADADALNVYRGDAASLRRDPGLPPLVLTPHHRELGRLVEVDGDEALARRHELVPALAATLDAIVVGKGPGTVVANGRGDVTVVTSGGPALGTGGSGDVLAGLLGAIVARGWHHHQRTAPEWFDDGPREWARLFVDVDVVDAVHLHGLLGELVGERTGGRATATGLVEALPGLLAEQVVTPW